MPTDRQSRLRGIPLGPDRLLVVRWRHEQPKGQLSYGIGAALTH
jgi:hypothetical protein